MGQIPGPGDAWGPCTGHPNDPDTPDRTVEFADTKADMLETRVRDIHGYFKQSFSEGEDHKLSTLSKAVLDDDMLMVYMVVMDMVKEGCTPTDAEVWEEME